MKIGKNQFVNMRRLGGFAPVKGKSVPCKQ